MTNKLPPHSLESERAVLGALLIDPDAMYQISDFLKPEDFYIGRHGLIYRTVQDMQAEGITPDVVSLAARLAGITRRSEADETGDLISLINAVPTALGIREYAKTVESASIRRKMIQAGGKIATLGYDEKGDIAAQLDELETMVFTVRGERSREGVRKPRQFTGDYLDWMNTDTPAARGLPTSLIDLDKLLGGLESPHQYILAARPGMGKSSLAGQIAINAAVNHGKRVAIFTLEMSERQILNRFVAHLTGIDSRALKTPWNLSQHDKQRVYEAVGKISDTRMFIDDSPALSASEIRAKAMRLHAEHGLDLIVVDHLHIMRPDRSLGRQDLEIAEMTRVLAEVGKQVNAPVLTLAQLNRSVEARQNKRPQMSDLRESGGIEENAYAIVFLFRDDYYNELSERPNVVEVIVAKNREGDTGKIDAWWHPQTTSFRNYANERIQI